MSHLPSIATPDGARFFAEWSGESLHDDLSNSPPSTFPIRQRLDEEFDKMSRIRDRRASGVKRGENTNTGADSHDAGRGTAKKGVKRPARKAPKLTELCADLSSDEETKIAQEAIVLFLPVAAAAVTTTGTVIALAVGILALVQAVLLETAMEVHAQQGAELLVIVLLELLLASCMVAEVLALMAATVGYDGATTLLGWNGPAGWWL
ncbi:hypothetical protein AB1Y20_021423 [Prymnesium parvum]|uniref:Transmembrane protein 107 n=1 Tax=Prymnesium parvum TaxID=97485 RepID=A0AB34JM99_PRYPA